WSGDPAELEWVKHDLTSLPYHLRTGGDAAVIGVGGGRDVLTALWARSRSVTGIEINGILLGLLRGDWREFTLLADRPGVTVALGTAALLERGVAEPSRCTMLAGRGAVSTLLLSNEPFSDEDVSRVHAACERFGFDLLAAPDVEPSTPLFGAVLRAHTRADLDR